MKIWHLFHVVVQERIPMGWFMFWIATHLTTSPPRKIKSYTAPNESSYSYQWHMKACIIWKFCDITFKWWCCLLQITYEAQHNVVTLWHQIQVIMVLLPMTYEAQHNLVTLWHYIQVMMLPHTRVLDVGRVHVDRCTVWDEPHCLSTCRKRPTIVHWTHSLIRNPETEEKNI